MQKKKKIIAGVVIFVFAAMILLGVYMAFGPKTTEGNKKCTLEVSDDKGKITTYKISTDAKYLREVMDELAEEKEFSYAGTEGEFGLYIESVNGLKADYEKDGAYWSVYINGEYGQNSIDTQPVKDGDTYRLAYETNRE